MKTLIINAHQKHPFSEGKLNALMVDTIAEEMEKNGHETKLTYIEQGFDIDEEVQKHL